MVDSNLEMIPVRRATLDDKPAIFEFIRIAYSGRAQYKIPHRWRWQFQENPFLSSSDLPVWIATDKGRVVAQTCAQIEPIKIGGKLTHVGWSVDTFVLPEYRGRGIGYRLQEANQQNHPVFMSLSMSKGNRRVKAALGSTALPPIKIFQLRAGTTASEMSRRGLCNGGLSVLGRSSAVNWIASKAASFYQASNWHAVKRRHFDEKFEMRQLARFTAGTDELWSRVSETVGISVHRCSELLNWKYVDQPHVCYQRVAAWTARSLDGYVVSRKCISPPEPDVGLIVDLVAMPSNSGVLRALVLGAVDRLRKQGAKTIEAATGHQEIEAIYKSLGFREVRKLWPMCHASPTAEIDRLGGPPFFSMGDHDIDQFPMKCR